MSKPAAVLLYSLARSPSGSETFTDVPFSTEGMQALLVLSDLSAISAGSVEFRLKAQGAFYAIDTYKTAALTATGFQNQSVGPGCTTNTLILPQMWIEVDTVTGPATYKIEVWGLSY